MIGLSEDINEAKLGDEAPKRRRLSDVVQSTYATYEDSVEKRLKTAPYAEQSTAARLSKGFSDNMRQALYTPQGIEIMYGQAKMTFGEMLGDEKMIERGRSLIQSANNEIEQAEIEAERKGFSFSPEDYKSFSYALGGGAANYGVMLAAAYATGGLSKAFKASQKVVGGVTEATGLTSNFVLEAVGKNQKALEIYKRETGDTELKEYNTQEGKKALAKSLIYGTGSTILEKFVGFGQQRKMFAKPADILTQTAKVSASEFTTEFSQSLLEMGIDYATGDIHWQDMPEELKNAFMEGAVGAVLGGSAGIASGLSQRAKVKNIIKDNIKGTVSEEKKEIIANEIYEEGNAQLSNVIAKELKYDTELRNKHGDIYYAMVGAVSKEMEGKPRFEGWTEDERASYANRVAEHFANNVLAEANFRNVLIDDVLSASDITYDNGIRIARNINLFDALKNPEMIPPQTKLKRVSLNQFIRSKGGVKDVGGDLKSRGAIKEYPGLINKNGIGLDDMAMMAWENGYFPEKSERPTVNDLLDAIDDGLRGNNRYNTEEERNFSDAIADLEEELDRLGIDYRNMTAAEIEQAVDEIPELKSMEREAAFYEDYEPDYLTDMTGMTEEERDAYDERMGMQLYQEGEEYNPREKMPKVRGGWTKAKILRYLKEWPSRSGVSNATRMIAEFDSVEDFKNNMFYHGSKYGTSKGMKPSITMSDREVERIGGGGYGEKYWAISLSKSKKVAGTFATSNLEGRGNIYPVLLAKNANVIEMPELSDSADLDDYIEKLYNDGVDAVWIGDKDKGEQELAVINPRAIVNIGTSQFYRAYKLGQPENPINIKSDEEIQKIYDFAKEYARKYPRHAPDEAVQEARGIVYWQSAFAGSRVDYDRPSLEAIGSGEGAQAHGWGLYYALNRDVAERYRENFVITNDNTTPEGLATQTYFVFDKNKNEAIKSLENYYNTYHKDLYKDALELLKKDDFKPKQGQVHEVDIPENPYLLDEQKPFSEQSDIVKNAIKKLNNEDVNDILDDDTTGEDIYGELVNYFSKQVEGNDLKSKTDKAQKLASQALEKVGIKGITYDGQQDGRCFVIFNPEDVKVIQKFYQRGKNAKGVTTITPDAYIINLLENADESTLPHELAHYWLTEMWNYVRSGRASENYMKRWNIIADYLGIKPEQTRLTRAQQEKFASSYEAYLTRGQLPTPLIGSVFDDYDKWLQRVYNDYNKINYQSGYGKRRVRLTDAAVKFFQSMTTGTLEAPILAPKDTGVKLETEPQLPATTSNELIEEPATSETTIVTRGDKGVSKVYKRGALLHPEAVSQPGLSYDKIHLDEQALAAKEFVEKDLNKAREFIGGEKNETGKLSRTAVMLAYENEMLRIGNLDEYDRVRKINAYESVRHGQEIAAQRIETDDVTNPAYWLEKAEHNLANQVAQKLFKGKERTKQLTETIKKETESLQKAITGKTVAEQQKIMRDTAERLKKEYGLDTLYQLPDEINRHQLDSFVKSIFGINLENETRNDIINKSEQVRKLWENTISKGGNPSVEAMKAKRELNDLINSKTPSNALAIWTSIFGRGVMLASVKSPVLNIISNIEAGLTEGITRRLMYGTTEKAVDKSVKEEFSKYAWEVYKASADIVTTMNDYDDDMRIIGEQILHSQGQGAFRAASRKVEEISFKYLMGAPDAVAKTFAFNDTADLLATKIAREEGAKDISKRATEIYKDAILIRPQTEAGQKVRKQAQEQAHYTTFTNDSWAARFGLKAREFLNTVGQGKIRLGDLAMKFVKTPANVQMMGLEYGFGLLYTAYNLQEIIRNPQSETSKIAIRSAVRNGLGIALAALLYSMLDPDDYFSEFDTLNPKEKDRMRALGASPNSIKIGNRWVSLDYFGQLGIPLVGMLEAGKNKSLRSYIQSGFTQAAKIPGIKETKQLIDSMSEYARYDLKPEKIAQMMAGTVLDQARAMTIPAIVNDIAKMTDDYERDTMGGVMDKVIASIPGLRQTLPERYGIQGVVKTEPAVSTLLFGSRVKTAQDDKLVREINKLAKNGEQPSISDVTKYGDLRLLSPEKKVRVRKEFYRKYRQESKELINTRAYSDSDDIDKKKALNKVRRNVVKSLKDKYSNDIQREKRRR